jgi:hypothetical protein
MLKVSEVRRRSESICNAVRCRTEIKSSGYRRKGRRSMYAAEKRRAMLDVTASRPARIAGGQRLGELQARCPNAATSALDQAARATSR